MLVFNQRTNKSSRVLAITFVLMGVLSSAIGMADEKNTNKLSVVGMADFYTPSIDSNSNPSSLTNSSKFGWGAGVLGETSFANSPIGLELGLLYAHRQNEFSSGGVSFKQSSNWLMLPLDVKLRFAKLFSVGAGPYVAYRLGGISNDGSVGNLTASASVTDQHRFEFGAFASLGATLPVNETMGVVVEGRYLRGLTNMSNNDSVNIKSADVQVLAGLQFAY